MLCSPGRVSGLKGVTANTDFFEAGGTSLVLLELQAKLRTEFHLSIPIPQLFGASTLRGMACLVEKQDAPAPEPLDWDEESSLTPEIREHLHSTPSLVLPEKSGIIVLTGSTGYLGHALLLALITDPGIREVRCIGVRDTTNFHRRLGDARVSTEAKAKVHAHGGDLKQPRIGLSEEDARRIFAVADCIIHNGAEVSHMQSYHSLRLPNVTSTKVLAAISAASGRRIPIHLISTVQVGVFLTQGGQETDGVEFHETSVAGNPPPLDGSAEGYPASKWVSERFLERLAEETKANGQWPVCVHRPALISRQADDRARDLLQNIRHFAMILDPPALVLPEDGGQLQGYLHTVAIGDVVAGVMGMLTRTGPEEEEEEKMASGGVTYRHYACGEVLRLDDPVGAVLGPEWARTHAGEAVEVQRLPPKEWARRAGALRLDASVLQWVEGLEEHGKVMVFPKVLAAPVKDNCVFCARPMTLIYLTQKYESRQII